MVLDTLVPGPYADLRTELYQRKGWTPPVPLEVKAFHASIPACSGLYIIYLINAAEQRMETVYIGQSSDLHERLGTLRREVYKDAKPDGSHHFAAPKLWALRHLNPLSHFEVSTFLLRVPTPRLLRLSLECLALYVARLRDPFPLLVNFGVHPEYPPIMQVRPPKMCGIVYDGDWYGLPWSAWIPVSSALPRDRAVYRVRLSGHARLVYVGYGRAREGVQRVLDSGSCEQDGYEISWACDEKWTNYHYQSIRNDLVGIHVYQLALAPSLQFLGS